MRLNELRTWAGCAKDVALDIVGYTVAGVMILWFADAILWLCGVRF